MWKVPPWVSAPPRRRRFRTLRLTDRVAIDVAVKEDDGTGRAAPDIDVHASKRWEL